MWDTSQIDLSKFDEPGVRVPRSRRNGSYRPKRSLSLATIGANAS